MTVYIVCIFMTVIDGTMVNVALPTMADEFGVGPTDVEWIAVGYLLALAAVIPAAGWVGDRFGTKRAFVVSLLVFTTMSLACGAAQSLEQLIGLRVLQGIGGGMLVPVGGAMLYRAFPMAERARAAVGVLSVAVVAPAIGPTLGGVLVDQASWRWIFLINVPIGIAGVAMSLRWLDEHREPSAGKLDVPGLVLSAAGVSTLLFALSTGPDVGWATPRTIGLAVAGVAMLVALVVVERRVDQPILALRLLRDRLFRTVNAAAALTYAGFFGLIFVLPLYLQSLRGYSALDSGLAQSPGAIGVLVVSNLGGKRLYQAIGPRRLMVVGTTLAAAISWCFGLLDLDTPLWVVGALSFARGAAIGMVFVSIQTAVYATTSLADTGRATSLFNTQRQISYASGVAAAATVLALWLGDVGEAAPAAERLGAYQAAFVATGLIMLPAAVIAWWVDDDDVAETRGLVVADRDDEVLSS